MRFFIITVLLLSSRPILAQLSGSQLAAIDSLKGVIDAQPHDSIKVQAYEAWENIIYAVDIEKSAELLTKIDALCDVNITENKSSEELTFFRRKKARALLCIGDLHTRKGDYRGSLKYFEQSQGLYYEISDNGGMGRAYNNGGLALAELGDYQGAMSNYEVSIELFKANGDSIGLANALSNSAIISANVGDYDLAISFFMKSLKIYENSKFLKGMASTYNNIGIVHQDQGNLDKALEYYNKTLQLRIDEGHVQGQGVVFNNIGAVYTMMDSNELALEYFEKGRAIAVEFENKRRLTESLNGFADVYISQGKYEQARVYLEEALSLCVEQETDFAISETYLNIARTYAGVGNYDKAIELGDKSLGLAKRLKALSLIERTSKFMYEWYKQNGKSSLALEMHELYIATKDSVMRGENQRELVNQEYKYQYEKQKTVDDAAYEKAKLLEKARTDNLFLIEKEKEKKQRIIIYSVSIGLVLVVVFLLFIFNRLSVTRNQKDEINRQKQAIDHQHSELALSHKEITDSINYAEHLQAAIFPSSTDLNEYLGAHFVLFKPKDVISGDFYWFERVNDVNYIAAADCTGHGVPGAILTVVCSNALNRSVKEYGLIEPKDILNKTREIVMETLGNEGLGIRDGMDISLAALYSDKIHYAGANNPLWIVRKIELVSAEEREARGTVILRDLAIIEFKGDKQPIGRYHKMSDFTQHEIPVFKDDRVFLFSDGYIDQFGGEKDKKFKSRPLKKLLLETAQYSIEEQKERLSRHFITWKGKNEQVDDVCVIGLLIEDQA